MSLLVAANLVDRIYMCADTRLSRVKELDGKYFYEKIHDNQLKLDHINHTNISIGCVGSPAMGGFLVKKIKDAKPTITYTEDLYDYLTQNENKVLQWVDEFICIEPATEYKYAKCVLLFAGQTSRRKRKINGKKLIELASQYQKASQDRIDNLFNGKPIEQLTQNEVARLGYEMKQHQMGLKHVIFEAITKNDTPTEFLELNTPDQTLFAMEINAENAYSQTKPIVKFVTYEWGKTAVYGAGYDSAILEPTFFGYLDMHMQSGEDKRDIIPFLQTIKDKFEDTIGGSITNLVIGGGKIYTMTGYMARLSPDRLDGPAEMLYHLEGDSDGNLYHTIDGVKTKLTPFTDTTKGNAAFSLSL